VYFVTADIEVQPWLPPLVAFCISFFTSMSGVSGAFLLLPFQVSYLGFTTPSVSATNHLFNSTATPGGLYRYIRDGRMAWPLAWTVIIGTLPGVLTGTIIRAHFLHDPTYFKRFIGLVLLYIGGKLLADTGRRKAKEEIKQPRRTDTSITHPWLNLKNLGYTFRGKVYKAPTPPIILLSLLVGLIGGIYGIGGGAFMAPFFISVFRLPVYTVAGAALMGTFVTSLAGVMLFQLLSLFYPSTALAPDWLLGLLFGAGGFAGMYCGAKLQPYVPARALQLLLACSILFIAFRYLS